MSATLEARLLSRVIADRNLAPLRALGVEPDWFKDDADRRVYAFVLDHYSKHGEVPSRQILKLSFPTYTVWKVEDALPALVELLRDKRAYGTLVGSVQDAGEFLEEDRDWKSAAAALREGLQHVEKETASLVDVSLNTNAEERIMAYDYLSEHPTELLGIPTGFPTIDKATLGLQPGQLVTIIATPKGGKSTLALRLAINAWMHEATKTLFVSFEMSNSEQIARHDAMIAGVPHTRLITGTLSRDERKRYEKALRATKGKHDFILSADANASTTVGGLAAKCEAHQPDLLVVDGVYLMSDENGEKPGSPQALTNITRALKRLAQRLGIPIVISTQVLPSKMSKRDGVTADAIGYSSSFFQDSDVILGLDRDPENDETRKLKVVESRNCGRVDTVLLWDWTTSRFEEDGGVDADDDDDDEPARRAFDDDSEDYTEGIA